MGGGDFSGAGAQWGATAGGATPQGKTATQKLEDKKKATSYKLVGQMGSSPNITFTMQVLVDGVAYLGSGRNLKSAKSNAAEKALRALGMWTAEDEQDKKTSEPKYSSMAPPKTSGYDVTRSGRGGFGRGRGGGASGWQAGVMPIKQKPFKSVMSEKWTNFKSGGQLGSTTGVNQHGVFTSRVAVQKAEEGEYGYDGEYVATGDGYDIVMQDYGYGFDDSNQAGFEPQYSVFESATAGNQGYTMQNQGGYYGDSGAYGYGAQQY